MTIDASTPFGQLVTQVHERAVAGDPAGLLSAAAKVSVEHAAIADQLLDHFVAHARQTGLSWTDIGTCLGVSRQAARQRFAPHTTSGDRSGAAVFAPDLQACLDQAEREARADGVAEIETEHLLAGLLAEGLAATVLNRRGVHAAAIRAASDRVFGRRPAAEGEPPTLSAEAVAALDSATRAAATTADPASGTPPQVDTGHLLAVLVLDPDSRARIVLHHLGVDIAAVKHDLRGHVSVKPTRPARWWKHPRPVHDSCSFCAQPTPTVGQLFRRPAVAICASCAATAVDTLDQQPLHGFGTAPGKKER